jgi:hypothetical protein
MPRQSPSEWEPLIVWDTGTGVVIREINTLFSGEVVFHGDQRTITLVKGNHWLLGDLVFCTYDVVNGTQLCQNTIHSSTHLSLGAFWAHEDTLRFATGVKINGKPTINIHGLQQTSTPPIHTVSLFPVPFYVREFSFSPVSLHASFVTKTELIVVDVQGPQILLQTRVAQINGDIKPQFSANGHFVACKTLDNEIYVWQNTPTGYVPWCSFRARLLFTRFSWSPTSGSILCWGFQGIQLLHPDKCLTILHPEVEPYHQYTDHLVAYSADKAHIAIAKQGCRVVTVLDSLLSTPQQVINTDMQIMDIKIVGNTIFVTDAYKLVSWELEAAGVVHCDHSAGRVINKSLPMNPSVTLLRLSHDCSQIAYANRQMLYMHNIQVQGAPQYIHSELFIEDVQFSPSDHQLWFFGKYFHGGAFYCKKSGMGNRWDEWSSYEGDRLEDRWSWVNLFSPHGYHVKMGSEWITNSRGRKLLWLPPAWRTENWKEVRWEGDFLAFLGAHHPKPIILEFQLHSIPPHPLGTSHPSPSPTWS